MLVWRICSRFFSPSHSVFVSPSVIFGILFFVLFVCLFVRFFFIHNCIALALILFIGHDLFGWTLAVLRIVKAHRIAGLISVALISLCIRLYFWIVVCAWLFAIDPSLFLFNIGFGFNGPCVAFFFCRQINCANNNMIELLSFLATRRAKAAKKGTIKKSTVLSERCVRTHVYVWECTEQA